MQQVIMAIPYIIISILLLLMAYCEKCLYDKFEYLFGLIGFYVWILWDYPLFVAILNLMWAILGAATILVAIWSTLNNCTQTEVDRRHSILTRNPGLTDHQIIFRVNCYYAFAGLLFVVFGLWGALVPGTIFGFQMKIK